MKWVKQENTRGCAIACIAMILGCTYQEALQAWYRQFPDSWIDWEKDGTMSRYLDQVLAANGVATARLYRASHHEPFEQCFAGHLRTALVVVHNGAPCSHYVVILPDDTILDPLTDEPRRLTDYHAVNEIAAVVPFRDVK